MKMINKILEKLPIVSCEEATRLASLSMERRLTLKETIDLKLHLFVCELCVNFLKQIRGLRLILRSYQPNQEIHLSQKSKDNIKNALKQKLK